MVLTEGNETCAGLLCGPIPEQPHSAINEDQPKGTSWRRTEIAS